MMGRQSLCFTSAVYRQQVQFYLNMTALDWIYCVGLPAIYSICFACKVMEHDWVLFAETINKLMEAHSDGNGAN